LSAALVSQLASVTFAAGDDFLESSPAAPNESPITRERAEYLQSKPYKNTTINVMVIRSAIGDCVEYHAPKWEEETGGHVNITKVPIDTLHQEIFADLKGPAQHDAYQTAAWFYGDYFTSDEPTIVEVAPFLKDPKYPCWDPDQFLPAIKRLCTWQGKLYGAYSMRTPRSLKLLRRQTARRFTHYRNIVAIQITEAGALASGRTSCSIKASYTASAPCWKKRLKSD
jgi:ABC-type glycerol-3-phosphate transport system substrate-binding protein